MSEHLPNLDPSLFDTPPHTTRESTHKPRILLGFYPVSTDGLKRAENF